MNTYDKLMAALERLNKALDTKAYDSLEEKYVNEAYRAHRDKPGIWLEPVEYTDLEYGETYFLADPSIEASRFVRQQKHQPHNGQCYRLPEEEE